MSKKARKALSTPWIILREKARTYVVANKYPRISVFTVHLEEAMRLIEEYDGTIISLKYGYHWTVTHRTLVVGVFNKVAEKLPPDHCIRKLRPYLP